MEKNKKTNKVPILSPENYIRQKSRNLPVGRCYTFEGWEEAGSFLIIISRQHTSGNITFCLYLVDLGCLGIKETYFHFNVPPETMEEAIKKFEIENMALNEIPYELAHNIIHAAVDYARKYGFEPCKDFTSITCHFLEEETDKIPSMDIHCGGKSGKPIYFNTGSETPAREKQILAQLEKIAGEGNFNCDEDLYEDEDEDDDEEDEEAILIREEYEALDIDEQKRLYVNFFDKDGVIKQLNYDEVKRSFILNEILAFTMVSKEEINEKLEELSNKFVNKFIPIDSFPNSLFTDVSNKDERKIIKLFFDAYEAIISESKQAKQAITKFRQKAGEVPVSEYVELEFFKKISEEKYHEKLNACYKKYPDYFLFQLFYFSDLKEKEIDIKFFEDLILNHTEGITTYEAENFFLVYSKLLIADENTELVNLLAFEYFLFSLDYLNVFVSEIMNSALKIARLKKVCRLVRDLI